MSILECKSCGVQQNEQTFYEFAFEDGPHRVCDKCHASRALHYFDATQHAGSLVRRNETEVSISVSRDLIRDLEEQLRNARDIKVSQEHFLAFVHDSILVGDQKRLQTEYQNMRVRTGISMPSAIRSILPPAPSHILAFLMASVERVGLKSPANCLTKELMDLIAMQLIVHRTTLVQEELNADVIVSRLEKVLSLPVVDCSYILCELFDQSSRRRMNMENMCLAHCDSLGIARGAVSETFKYMFTSWILAQDPFSNFEITDTSGHPRKRIPDARKTAMQLASEKRMSRNKFDSIKEGAEMYTSGLTTLVVTDVHGMSRKVPVCIMICETYDGDTEDEETNRIEAQIEQLPVPICSMVYAHREGSTVENVNDVIEDRRNNFFIYNLDTIDLVLAPGSVQASFGMHSGDLVSYSEDNPDYQDMFNSTTIPAKGIGNVGGIHFMPLDEYLSSHIRDATGAIILTLCVYN